MSRAERYGKSHPLAPKALSHFSLRHIALGIRLLGNPSAEGHASILFETRRLLNHRVSIIERDGAEVNRAFSAGTLRVS
jgi:hypothetical protein